MRLAAWSADSLRLCPSNTAAKLRGMPAATLPAQSADGFGSSSPTMLCRSCTDTEQCCRLAETFCEGSRLWQCMRSGQSQVPRTQIGLLLILTGALWEQSDAIQKALEGIGLHTYPLA